MNSLLMQVFVVSSEEKYAEERLLPLLRKLTTTHCQL